jgi:hypothetical protein
MISQDRDYEDILRHALRAAAESVEPASDGLERIRHRSHSRRSARSMQARAADWLRLHRIRLSIRLESFRWELSQRGIGPPPTGPDHDGRTPAGKTAARLGPAAAWLKPAFAVAAVVAVVVAGVVALNRMQEAVIAPANSVASPGSQHAPAAATGLANPGLWQPPMGVNPSAQPGTSKKKNQLTVPAVACTPTPTPSASASPTTSASASPSPTPSDTATTGPSPTPSDTGSPTVTPTTGTGGGTASGSASVTKATADVMFAPDTDGGTPDVSCGSNPHTATPKTHATS